ncbi:hypothetical protein [uncultured Lacinutrix sp.]|uniref:hypothetical protein n=1 Tax=uncultured Lacinutrix sp. TaxID=574032 RepID=UPI0026043D14|nr:hypothetical protein [uncultured Lacinutrix sp.]
MKQNIETLKSYFETGDKPKQQEYEDLIDSLVHVDQSAKIKYFNLFEMFEGNISTYTYSGTQKNFELDTNEIGLFYARVQNNDQDQYDGTEIYLFNKGKGKWGGGNDATQITLDDFSLVYKSQYATDLALGFRDENLGLFEHNTVSDFLISLNSRIPNRVIENIDIVNGYLQLTTDSNPREIVAQISIQALKTALDQVV